MPGYFESGTRFADQVEYRHGPVDLFRRWFTTAEQACRDRGVHLRMRHDFHAFRDLNNASRENAYRFAILDPDCSRLGYENAYWFEGLDEQGELVATMAGRFYDWTGTDLGTELTSMRMLYTDPATQALPGEHCEVDEAVGKRITGRVCYSGGGWFNPAYRGVGLSSILPCCSRLYALTRWDTQFTFSFVREAIVKKGVAGRYGYTRMEPGIRFRGSFMGDLDYYLISMEPPELYADLERRLASFENRAAAVDPDRGDKAVAA